MRDGGWVNGFVAGGQSTNSTLKWVLGFILQCSGWGGVKIKGEKSLVY